MVPRTVWVQKAVLARNSIFLSWDVYPSMTRRNIIQPCAYNAVTMMGTGFLIYSLLKSPRECDIPIFNMAADAWKCTAAASYLLDRANKICITWGPLKKLMSLLVHPLFGCWLQCLRVLWELYKYTGDECFKNRMFSWQNVAHEQLHCTFAVLYQQSSWEIRSLNGKGERF